MTVKSTNSEGLMTMQSGGLNLRIQNVPIPAFLTQNGGVIMRKPMAERVITL